ncbi:MAG: potassium channel family protein [Actinomycetota bacterium]|nr:potassium channel family protein [Actinomycetota bacterium]
MSDDRLALGAIAAPPAPDRVGRWEAAGEWPLAAIALLFLGAYAWPIMQEAISPDWQNVCRWVDYAAWVAFLADYVVRLVLARDRRQYAARHVVDVVIIVLPMLRPLRLLRLVMLLRVMNRRATTSLRGRVVLYVVASTGLVIFCGALAALSAERHHDGANIETFGDALWWACVTITTIGYGDRFPVTGEGRLVGVGLMLAGIALLGIVTASIASWLIDKVREVEQDTQAATSRDLRELRDEIRALHEQLAASGLRATGARPPSVAAPS